MSFRIQKDSSLDYLQVNNSVIPGSNNPVIYFNSQGQTNTSRFIGPYGVSFDSSDSEVILSVGGTFSRLFVSRMAGNPGDTIKFTIFINGSPITDTTTLVGGAVTGELTFNNPSIVNFSAGDRVSVRLDIVSGSDPFIVMTLS